MIELEAHITAQPITANLTLVQCEFHTVKKLSLQESNQLIGMKMPISVFSRNI